MHTSAFEYQRGIAACGRRANLYMRCFGICELWIGHVRWWMEDERRSVPFLVQIVGRARCIARSKVMGQLEHGGVRRTGAERRAARACVAVGLAGCSGGTGG